MMKVIGQEHVTSGPSTEVVGGHLNRVFAFTQPVT
jgi:hypothetical protein